MKLHLNDKPDSVTSTFEERELSDAELATIVGGVGLPQWEEKDTND